MKENFEDKINNVEKFNNIITFKNENKKLTEDDIKNLFWGLFGVIKKMAYEEAEMKINYEKSSLKFLLNKTINDLNRKKHIIEKLEKKISNLNLENNNLTQAVKDK